MSNFQIKITAGKLKSQILNFSKNTNIKPTKSYIRELIFNVIAIRNTTRCLDLFAGSGILTAEAFSRGADHIDLVEKSSITCNLIKKEFKRLSINKCEIHNDTVETFLERNKYYKYNIIFIDPPYNSNLLISTLKYIVSSPLLSDTDYIYFEQGKNLYDRDCIDIIHNTYSVVKNLSIGDVSYTIAKKR